MHEPNPRGSQSLTVGMALGTAFGIALGFIPKDTLVFYVVMAAALLAPTNLAVLVLTTLLFHGFGQLCGPLFHKLGGILLTEPRLVGFWTRVAQWPVAPWTRFNNTIVMGAVASSLLLFWPVFLISLPVFHRVADRLTEWVTDNGAYRWLVADGSPSESSS